MPNDAASDNEGSSAFLCGVWPVITDCLLSSVRHSSFWPTSSFCCILAKRLCQTQHPVTSISNCNLLGREEVRRKKRDVLGGSRQCDSNRFDSINSRVGCMQGHVQPAISRPVG